MTKKINKIVNLLLTYPSDAECDEFTRGEKHGLLLALEAMTDEEKNYEGCVNCRYEHKDADENPCKFCKHNFVDRWERRND